jgi:hypothetical protein
MARLLVVGTNHCCFAFIHMLLVIAVVVIPVRVLQGQRPLD